MRVLVMIPTTNGPSQIVYLRKLSRVPLSQIVTDGDFLPDAALSERYHALTTGAGPVAELFDLCNERYELCLDRTPETGRSWELPVAIAHWVLAKGHSIVTEDPDLVIWATGAIASPGAIALQDYHLPSKLDQSTHEISKLVRKGAEFLFVLPTDCPNDRARIGAVAPSASISSPKTLDETILCLDRLVAERHTPTRSAVNRRLRNSSLVLAILLLGGGLLTLTWFILGKDAQIVTAIGWNSSSSGESTATEGKISGSAAGSSIPPIGAREAEAKGSAENAGDLADPDRMGDMEIPAADEEERDVPSTEPALSLGLIEYRAPENATCVDVLFGAESPRETSFVSQGGALPDSIVSGLCAVAFHTVGEAPNAVLELPSEFLARLWPSDRDDSIALEASSPIMLRLLRDAAVPLRYQVELRLDASGEQKAFQHALIASPE